MKIGVLAIQGSVVEHFISLEKAGIDAVHVKKPRNLKEISGLIIPGGESTTIGKLLERFELDKAIKEKASKGMGIWGTCAGAILIAKNIMGKQQAQSLELMDITIERNAFGRQLDSFETKIPFKFEDQEKSIPAVFIRAPKIIVVEKDSEILAKYKGDIVAAKQGKFLATSFHPEMTDSSEVHKFFARMCES